MFFKQFKLPTDPVFRAESVDIRDFGAEEGAFATSAINAAIDFLSERGGGRVVVPRGRWLSGAIHLKSNINLHFEEGSFVQFSANPEDYLPAVFTMYEGIRCINYSPLIYGRGLENIAVTGKGILDGNGPIWWSWAKNLNGRDILYFDRRPVEERVYGTPELALRPMFLQILESKNVLIEGITLNNSPCWTVHPVFCEDVTVRGVTIENPTVSPNTDGVNIESCNRALVEDCTVVMTGDDMFCLKAGRNEDAWEVGIPCENVVIRNCRSIGPSSSGGVVIGSEMSADVRNILVENCDFAHNANCIRIKAKDGRGGVVENIDYKNLRLKKGSRGINLSFRYSCEAIDDPLEPGKYLPTIRNIYCENIICDSVSSGLTLDNIPGAVMENLHFKNITMTAGACMTVDSVDGLYLDNVNLTEQIDAGQAPLDSELAVIYGE
ncbi:MAG: glycoside hydrolase family 28 protein [Clostridia bacterium]|nr:glycoside hydrolase family 28 protein [Clostridia bacterium]